MRRRKSFSSRCPKWLSVVLVVALLLPDGICAAPLYRRSPPRPSVAAGSGELLSDENVLSVGPNKPIDERVFNVTSGSGFEFTAIRPSCLVESSKKDDNKVTVSIGNSDCKIVLKWSQYTFFIGDVPVLTTYDRNKDVHSDVKVDFKNEQLSIRRVTDQQSSSEIVPYPNCNANFDEVPPGYAMKVEVKGSPRCDIKLEFPERYQVYVPVASTLPPSTPVTPSSPPVPHIVTSPTPVVDELPWYGIAGIVVGVLLIIAFVVALICCVCCCSRRRKESREEPENPPPTALSIEPIKKLPTQPTQKNSPPSVEPKYEKATGKIESEAPASPTSKQAPVSLAEHVDKLIHKQSEKPVSSKVDSVPVIKKTYAKPDLVSTEVDKSRAVSSEDKQ